MKKELPEDISLLTENLEKYENGASRSRFLDRAGWRDFFEQQLHEQGDSATVRKYLGKDPATIIELVLKQGMIPLGGNCRLIKCPVVSRPSVCALCPLSTTDGEHPICSGPTVQRKPGPLALSKTPRYDDQWFKNHCPYRISRLDTYDPERDDGFKHLLELVWPVLQRHPDYDVVDYREKYADELEEVGIL